MNRKRETHNFTDALALSADWHRKGMRYIEARIVHRMDVLSLAGLVRILSPDDRFAVDLLPIGPNLLEATAHGYIFKNQKEDDSRFCLESLDPIELSELLDILNITEGVIEFSCFECMSSEARGNPTRLRKFTKIRNET